MLDAVDLLDAGMPADMLPEALQKFFYGANDATLMIVKFDGTSASKETMAAVRQIKGILGEAQFIGGMSAILEDTKALVDVYKRQAFGRARPAVWQAAFGRPARLWARGVCLRAFRAVAPV